MKVAGWTRGDFSVGSVMPYLLCQVYHPQHHNTCPFSFSVGACRMCSDWLCKNRSSHSSYHHLGMHAKCKYDVGNPDLTCRPSSYREESTVATDLTLGKHPMPDGDKATCTDEHQNDNRDACNTQTDLPFRSREHVVTRKNPTSTTRKEIKTQTNRNHLSERHNPSDK